MALPVLFRFLDNPSYLDRRQYGHFWKEQMNYDERWQTFKRSYNNLNIDYYIENDASYYVVMKIPSNQRGNTYDVVIHFLTDSKVTMTDHSLRNYNIQIFSNNPVFGFHFGYANYHAGIIIPFLAKKLGTEILKTPAVKYNPRNAMGYDHSFYFAGMYLTDSARLLNKEYIRSKAQPFSEKAILTSVRSFEETMAEYQENKDHDQHKKTYNKDKSLVDKAKELVDDASSKVGELVDRTFHRGQGSRVVKPSKSVGSKGAISSAKHITPSRNNTTAKTKSAITHKKPKRKI